MRRVKFSVYQMPGRNGKKQPYARLITRGTKRMDEICSFISESSSLNSADIKGALDILSRCIGRELSFGYSVELEGIGHFSPALRMARSVDDKGRSVSSVYVGGVNFRSSARLKEMVKVSFPQKVKRNNIPTLDIEGRRVNMLAYLRDKTYINRPLYAGLNACSLYCAGKELKQFCTEGIIRAVGRKTHPLYVLPGEGK